MRGLKLTLAAVGLFILAACAGTPRVVDDWAVVQKARYVHNEPASLTLITMVNNKTGRGGHSALLINSTERVMWDPAGRFKHSVVPERDDVLFGISPRVLEVYNSFHARNTFHVVMQEVQVPPEVALQAYELALANGSAADATCSTTTSRILQQLPGFASINSTLWPHNLMDNFDDLPGVKTTKVFEDDEGQNLEG